MTDINLTPYLNISGLLGAIPQSSLDSIRNASISAQRGVDVPYEWNKP